MKVLFTRSAAADLERITDHIAEMEPERARLTVRGLRAAALSIGMSPRMCSPVVTSPGVRKKSFRPYAILFTIAAEEAIVLRVAHERSDWTSLV